MIKNFLKCQSRNIIAFFLAALFLYGCGRLYFELTAGFTEGNILIDLHQEANHGLPLPSEEDIKSIHQILQQPYRYLGKGCQSYVFISADGNFVIKFLKLQRFRPNIYVKTLSSLPYFKGLRQKKEEQKRAKLDLLLDSWKIAYLNLPQETGVIYVHLNPSNLIDHPIKIIDKIGLSHLIDPNQCIFLIQRSAKMLCKSLKEKMDDGNQAGAERILDNLISNLIAEYQKGLGDNDHALMQNTGVIADQPIHIDVGQFSCEERFKDPEIYKEEIFSKTYKFRIWLAKHHPELENYLEKALFQVIGPKMREMKPKLKTVDEGA